MKMKKKKKLILLAMLICLLCSMPVSAAGTKDGWKKTAGSVYYYKNGKPVKGFVKINGITYYFDQKGRRVQSAWIRKNGNIYRTDRKGRILKKRFVTVNGRTYYLKWNGVRKTGWGDFKAGRAYFGTNGVMRKGVQKIGKSYYFFSSQGYLQTGIQTKGNTTYYVNSKGKITRSLKEENGTAIGYDSSGKALDQISTEELLADICAARIVSQVTNSSMTDAQKLRACFDWVVKKPYATLRTFRAFEGWTAVYANDHFVRGRGNCHSDAAAFAYLAKALGYQNVYVCVDSDGTNVNGHSWTEINGLAYDPLFAESKGFAKNYGVPYGVYILHPILKVKIA
ncbi:MAG: transglutaminase domain-containing protein [Candidatus Limivivens sp.]|nr:transglutaminase domain-containing protein [Candidatus Limivivens sp.]